MLKKFSVENFKGFKDKITLDIGTPSNYSFNSEIIENGCITKGIIYGINSCGKSNLGLAIFDIITHLTEKQKLLGSYDFYLNMSNLFYFFVFQMAVQRFGCFIFTPPITKQTRREGAAEIHKLYNKISTNCIVKRPQIV